LKFIGTQWDHKVYYLITKTPLSTPPGGRGRSG